MTSNAPATCEAFEIIDANGDRFLKAYSPAKFDKILVNTLKRLRGTYCRKDARGFVWGIAADHICADDFRAAFASAAARMNQEPVGKSGVNSDNLAYHMYNSNGALFG